MKLLKDIYSETFRGKHIRLYSPCTIAPVDITGTVLNIGFNINEPLFYIKCDKTKKIYAIGGFTKDLQYEFK